MLPVAVDDARRSAWQVLSTEPLSRYKSNMRWGKINRAKYVKLHELNLKHNLSLLAGEAGTRGAGR